jgi:hypothetical protein
MARCARSTERTPTLVNRGLVYDGVGNITNIADGVNNEAIAYSYDDLNPLTSASLPAGESYATTRSAT